FPGLDSQSQALEYGSKVAGCTVHFVDAGVDTGPIVAQRAVPVLDEDRPQDLAARILEQEHQIYPEALARLFNESWSRQGRRIVFANRKESP
nr:phosphoribosylglycinamide formyltransferase [bacterium]